MSTQEIGHAATENKTNANMARRFTRRAIPKTLLVAIALGVTLGVGASAATDVSALPKHGPGSPGSCWWLGEYYPAGAIRTTADGKQYMCQYGEWVPKGQTLERL